MKAIYAFSGDPITNGHINLVERAAKLFDHLVVGIGRNVNKSYLFSEDERVEMARRALSHISNVEVCPFDGMLVDFAYSHGIDVIIRGIRNSGDFEYENLLHQAGTSLGLGIETLSLFADRELAHVSSGVVKALQSSGGTTLGLVPLHVKQALEERISKQYILGVTGVIGSGKTHLCRQLSETFNGVYHINFDEIGHEILDGRPVDFYGHAREQIQKEFLPESKTIDRKELGEMVFNDPKKLSRLNEIMMKPIIGSLRRKIFGKEGLILLDCPLLVESGLLHLCNNHVVLVKCSPENQRKRLLGRGYSQDKIDRRIESQYNFENKRDSILSTIQEDAWGSVLEFDTGSPPADLWKHLKGTLPGLERFVCPKS